MSRIQDILAKAERDGTARRLPGSSSGVVAEPDIVVSHLFVGISSL